jgi:hypothetical protein
VSVRDCQHAAFTNTTFHGNVGGALFIESSAVDVQTSAFLANVGVALGGSDLSALLVMTKFRDASGESIRVSRERGVELRLCEFAGRFSDEISSSSEAVRFDCRELVSFGPHLLGQKHPDQKDGPKKLRIQPNPHAGKPNPPAGGPNYAQSGPKGGPARVKDAPGKPKDAPGKPKDAPGKPKDAPGKQGKPKGPADAAGKKPKGGKEPPKPARQRVKVPSGRNTAEPKMAPGSKPTPTHVVVPKPTIRQPPTPIVEVVEKREVLNVLIAAYVLVIFLLVVTLKLFFQQMPGGQAKQILDNDLLVEPVTDGEKEEAGFAAPGKDE